MYSADLGRFLQRDPAGYVDGLNLYAYVRNNPLLFVDPNGLMARSFGEDFNWYEAETDYSLMNSSSLSEQIFAADSGQVASGISLNYDTRSTGFLQVPYFSKLGYQEGSIFSGFNIELSIANGATNLVNCGIGIANTGLQDAQIINEYGPLTYGIIATARTVNSISKFLNYGKNVVDYHLTRPIGQQFSDAANLWTSPEYAESMLTMGLGYGLGAGASRYASFVDDFGFASKKLPNERGFIREFVQEQDEVYYRVFSGDRNVGSYLTKTPPKSSAYAQEALSLPPQNKAELIQEVVVPAGTKLRRSRAASMPEWGRYRGGAEQFELLDRIPTSNFGPGRTLP